MFPFILRSACRAGKSLSSTVLKRTILSEAYACDSIWNERLQSSAFQKVNPADLGMLISQRLDKNEAVSPLDIDIYANVMHRLDITTLWFFEEILQRFRKTQQCIHILDSTHHAVVRGYLELQEHGRLMDVLQKKSEYGIFLDDYSAILLMSDCLKRGDAAMAAQAAYEVMLQEGDMTESPLLAALSLRSCQLHWKSVQEAGGWPTVEHAEEEVDEDDIEYVVVKFVRNDNYDDHFDLSEDRLLLGKTFISLNSALKDNPVIANSSLLLGLAMYEKFGRLGKVTDKLIKQNMQVTKNTIDDVLFLLESTPTLPEGKENGPRKRHYITEAEKETIVAEFQELLPKLSTSTEDFHDLCSDFVNTVITDCQSSDIQRMQNVYKTFEENRKTKIENELKELKQREVHDSAKQKLRELLDKEELLLSYENRADIDYAAWLAPRSRAEKRRTRREEWQKDIDNIPKTTSRTFLDIE